MTSLLLALGLSTGAAAASGGPTAQVAERLAWEIRYLGVVAGHVEATTRRDGDAWVTEGLARSAPWYRRVYDLDDHVVSTWVEGEGSRRYVARFREGTFHQDQDQRFEDATVEVDLRQRRDHGWEAWSDSHGIDGPAWDPVAAMQVVRGLEGDGPWSVPVFSGRRVWPLHVELLGVHTEDHPVLGRVSVRAMSLRTRHRGELEQRGRFVVQVTDDARRLLVAATVRTSVGAIRARLIEHAPWRNENDRTTPNGGATPESG